MNLRTLLLSFSLLCVSAVYAQNAPDNTVPVYQYVEQMPVPHYELNRYLNKNLHYPDSAREHDIEGKVVLSFVVSEDGSIADVEVLRGVSDECDSEAVRVIKTMPAWQPGKQNGVPVKVRFTQSITFKLEGKVEAKTNQPTKLDISITQPKPPYDLNAYFNDNLHYPKTARKQNIQGKVIVVFLINEDGSISDVRLLSGIGGGCDEEALRVVKNMPAWTPGKKDGKAAKIYMKQPVSFELNNE